MTELDDIAMQHHCLHCLREQWAPAVFGVSHGRDACVWCGAQGARMTNDEYYAELRKRRSTGETQDGQATEETESRTSH